MVCIAAMLKYAAATSGRKMIVYRKSVMLRILIIGEFFNYNFAIIISKSISATID